MIRLQSVAIFVVATLPKLVRYTSSCGSRCLPNLRPPQCCQDDATRLCSVTTPSVPTICLLSNQISNQRRIWHFLLQSTSGYSPARTMQYMILCLQNNQHTNWQSQQHIYLRCISSFAHMFVMVLEHRCSSQKLLSCTNHLLEHNISSLGLFSYNEGIFPCGKEPVG